MAGMDIIGDIRHRNLLDLVNRAGGPGKFAELIQKDPAQISQWINRSPDSKTGNPRQVGDKSARHIEKMARLPKGWMDAPHHPENQPRAQVREGDPPAYIGKDANPSRYQLDEGNDENGAMPVDFMDAAGSCGGGAINFEAELRQPLLKEPAWFKRYRITPQETLAVWADGDSMANFIVDGDIVIFNRARRTPRSGQIFLIEHPDGLRIKRLRREIDGTWVLESDNPDKRRYPDERIGPEDAHLLNVVGEFVYRQGG